jgi:hypothetical protein
LEALGDVGEANEVVFLGEELLFQLLRFEDIVEDDVAVLFRLLLFPDVFLLEGEVVLGAIAECSLEVFEGGSVDIEIADIYGKIETSATRRTRNFKVFSLSLTFFVGEDIIFDEVVELVVQASWSALFLVLELVGEYVVNAATGTILVSPGTSLESLEL